MRLPGFSAFVPQQEILIVFFHITNRHHTRTDMGCSATIIEVLREVRMKMSRLWVVVLIIFCVGVTDGFAQGEASGVFVLDNTVMKGGEKGGEKNNRVAAADVTPANPDNPANVGPSGPNPAPPEPFNGGGNPFVHPNPNISSNVAPLTLYTAREVNNALRNGNRVFVTTDLSRCTLNESGLSSVAHTGMHIQNFQIDDNQRIRFSTTSESLKPNANSVVKFLEDYQLDADGSVLVRLRFYQPFGRKKADVSSYLCAIGRGVVFKAQ